MTECTVSAPSRVHFGLVDFTNASPRKFGGVGVMLSYPRVIVNSRLSATSNSVGGEHIDDRLEVSVMRALARLTDSGCPPVHVDLLTPIPRHVGLGTGTATVMAAMYGAVCAAGIEPIQAELSLLSGRGGASGIGVYGAWRGGWVVDAGQPHGSPLLPSGEVVPKRPSLVCSHFAAPIWTVDLYLHPRGAIVQPGDERLMFEDAAKDSPIDTLTALGLLHHGIVPALLEEDLMAFGSYIRRFQSIGLKRREMSSQTEDVQGLAMRLADLYAAVGLSSFGPVLVALRHRESEVPPGEHLEHLFATTNVASSGMHLL